MTAARNDKPGQSRPGLNRKDLCGLADVSADEISFILDTAESFKEISRREIKKVPTLRGKAVILFFHEASTRTKTSFDIAAKRLSADTHSLGASGSSIVKGETLIDTARNLEAMNPDAVIIRHSHSGAPHLLAGLLKCSVINAGDGAHEHPTQGPFGHADHARFQGRDCRAQSGHHRRHSAQPRGKVQHDRPDQDGGRSAGGRAAVHDAHGRGTVRR